MIEVKEFFDNETATFTYIVIDKETRDTAIIDPVLNYDQSAGLISTKSAEEIIAFITSQMLTLRWLLETHIHADHLSSSLFIKQKCGGELAISSSIITVLDHWIPLFNSAHDTANDASQFDLLLNDGDLIVLGKTPIRVMHTPGHTPACASYLIDDCVFVGDALFQPDVGTGRADFPGASADDLYDSLQKILSLPPSTKIFSGHDYPPGGRPHLSMSTVAEQLAKNTLIKAGVSKKDFVEARIKRDTGKPVPKLLYPSLQVNLRGGSLGRHEENGRQFIKIPVAFA
jgi:glyoxylase-like metal-dependent hydrolase (beta-lactamase superfamily II)